MRMFRPELLSNNITIQLNNFRPHLGASVLTGDFNFLLDDCCPLFELSWLVVIINPKLREENLILLP